MEKYRLSGPKNDNNSELNNIGIYSITNGRNGKTYIGATRRSFSHRKYEHYTYLKLNKHRNKYLQLDFNNYGENEFSFSILEETIFEEKIPELELKWLKKTNDNNLYNISRLSSGLHEAAKYHGKFYDPVGNIHHVYNLERFCRENNLSPRAMAAVRNGTSRFCKGWSLVGSGYKPFEFLSPNGILYSWIHVVEQFCKEHNLSPSSMSSVHHKRFSHHRGWRLKDTNIQWPAFVSPNNKIYTGIWNVKEFAKEHDLHGSLLFHVLYGKRNHHRGWTLYKEHIPLIKKQVKVGYQEKTS